MFIVDIILLIVVMFCILIICGVIKELAKIGAVKGFKPIIITFLTIYVIFLIIASQGFVIVLIHLIKG